MVVACLWQSQDCVIDIHWSLGRHSGTSIWPSITGTTLWNIKSAADHWDDTLKKPRSGCQNQRVDVDLYCIYCKEFTHLVVVRKLNLHCATHVLIMVTHNADVRFMNMALSNDQRIDGIVINILIQFHLTLHMMLIQILSYYNLNWYIQSNKLITIWTYFVPQHTLSQSIKTL